MFRKLVTIPIAISIVFAAAGPAAAANQRFIRHESVVPNQYIVALVERNPHAIEGLTRSIARSYGGEVLDIYATALGGFLMNFPPEAAERLSSDPRVRWVEEDAILQQIQPSISASRSATLMPSGLYLWHLDHLDEQHPAFNSTTKHKGDNAYEYCTTGLGVNAYVMDTGIWTGHTEFSGRAPWNLTTNNGNPCPVGTKCVEGISFIDQDPDPFPQCATEAFSHGTAVASILAGNNNGVASDVNLISVRTNLCGGLGSVSRYIGALNWLVNKNGLEQVPSFRSYPLNPHVGQPGVLNWSGYFTPGSGLGGSVLLTGYKSDSVEVALRDVAYAGIVIVTAADNFNSNSCAKQENALSFRYNTNRTGYDSDGTNQTAVTVVPNVISVGGTSINQSTGNDERWVVNAGSHNADDGSNSGRCIDMWAPAANVPIASNKGSSLYSTAYSGTSWSSPIIAGMVARYLQYLVPSPQSARNAFDWLDFWGVRFDTDGSALVKNTLTSDGFDTRDSSGAFFAVPMPYFPKPDGGTCRTRPLTLQN